MRRVCCRGHWCPFIGLFSVIAGTTEDVVWHGYQRAGIPATWNIIEKHLPPPAIAIEQLITETEQRA